MGRWTNLRKSAGVRLLPTLQQIGQLKACKLAPGMPKLSNKEGEHITASNTINLEELVKWQIYCWHRWPSRNQWNSCRLLEMELLWIIEKPTAEVSFMNGRDTSEHTHFFKRVPTHVHLNVGFEFIPLFRSGRVVVLNRKSELFQMITKHFLECLRIRSWLYILFVQRRWKRWVL